jgi:hypothetical protein
LKTQRIILGLAEARFGLGLVILFLLVLGYVTLQRFGGTGNSPPVEFRPIESPKVSSPATGPAPTDLEPLHLITPQSDQPLEPFRLSERPDWSARALDPSEAASYPADQLFAPETITNSRGPEGR